jgi:hypothetical protein
LISSLSLADSYLQTPHLFGMDGEYSTILASALGGCKAGANWFLGALFVEDDNW